MTRVSNPQVLQAVDQYLDENIDQHEKIGELFAHKMFSTSQVRNLQQIVITANRYTAIINFVKNQIGKSSKRKSWASLVGDKMIGEVVLDSLEMLMKQAQKIAEEFGESPYTVALQLARGWVEQVVSHYLYCKTRREVT